MFIGARVIFKLVHEKMSFVFVWLKFRKDWFVVLKKPKNLVEIFLFRFYFTSFQNLDLRSSHFVFIWARGVFQASS